MTNMPTPLDTAAPTPADPRRRSRIRAFTVSGIAAACLLGGAATAYAADGGASTPSTPPAGSSSQPSTPPTSTAPAKAGAQPRPAKHAPHLDGTVLRSGAGTITITDRDGFTRTIDVTAATVYTGGLSATPTTGTRIHAEGTVDSNGTALDATRIGSHPTPPAGGAGRHGKPGHGAPKPGGPAGQAKPAPGAAPKTGGPVGPGKHGKPGHGKPGSGAPKAGGPAGQAKPAPATAPPGKPTAPAGTTNPTPAPTS